MEQNRTGIRTIMVRYIHPKEEIQIVLKRKLEKIVLFFFTEDIRNEQSKRGRRKMKIAIGNDHAAVEMKQRRSGLI